jgi:hypothetical protein
MAGDQTSTPGVAPPVVIGKRLPFWRDMSLAGAAFVAVSPLLILWAGRWFVGLARQRGHLLDDGHVGDTLVGSAFFAVVALVGLAGLWGFIKSLREFVLEFACPSCGVLQQRSFGAPSEPRTTSQPCRACQAYLRARGIEVREELSNAVDTMILPYEILPERYLPIATRDALGRFQFKMPPICANCGSSDAGHFRDIEKLGSRQIDFGVVGSIASMAVDEVSTDAQLAYRNRLQHSAPITKEDPSEALDAGLRDLKVPVCAKHTGQEDPLGDLLNYSSGRLSFASYRYYKAFCALNQIGTTLKSVTSTTGAPEASSPQ